MLSSLFILLLTTAYCAALGATARWRRLAHWAAIAGVAAALVVALAREGLEGGGAAGTEVVWPAGLKWLGGALYRSDTLAAGLGAWCLLLGLFLLLQAGAGLPRRNLPGLVGLLAVLYSLVHTDHLLAFAVQLLVAAALVLLLHIQQEGGAGDYTRGVAGLGLGAAMLVGAALLVGRTMGGVYGISTLSLSALSVWPLLLVAGFALLWLGLPPATAWSGRWGEDTGPTGVLTHALVIGTPPILLLLRLQGLVSTQALAGTVPPGWTGFMAALGWFGAVGTLVASAGMLVWAGSPRWPALLTAHTMSMSLWALSMDDPAGRVACLAIFFAFGASRLLAELCRGGASSVERAGKVLSLTSLAAAPGTALFVGVWLLAANISRGAHPGLAILLLAALILAACGVVLNSVAARTSPQKRTNSAWQAWVTGIAAITLLVGGALPGLWLPAVARLAAVAGGNPSVSTRVDTLEAGGLSVPLLWLVLGVALLVGLAWLVALWARASANTAGVLLPTAIDRLQRSAAGSKEEAPVGRNLLGNPPPVVWWLSLSWLEGGVWGFGALLATLGTRLGGLMGRLEGRFYLPMALVLALIALLVASR